MNNEELHNIIEDSTRFVDELKDKIHDQEEEIYHYRKIITDRMLDKKDIKIENQEKVINILLSRIALLEYEVEKKEKALEYIKEHTEKVKINIEGQPPYYECFTGRADKIKGILEGKEWVKKI